MPAAGGPLGHEDRADLGQPVTEADVLAQPEIGVHAVRLEVERPVQRGGRAHVGAQRVGTRPAQVVGALVDVLDPVPLLLLTLEQLADPVEGDPVAHLLRSHGEHGRRVDEPLVPEHHCVVDDVVPAQLGLEVLALDEHVGVQPVDYLALGGQGPGVAGVRAAPALLDAGDAGVLRTDVGQLHQARAVVGDDDLEQVRGIGLRGQPGEHGGQQAAGVVRRDHHRHAERGLPGAEVRHGQVAPVVAADARLVGHGASLSSWSSSAWAR